MGQVLCDRLTVSVPKTHDAALADVAREFGVEVGAVPAATPGVWVSPSGGSLFYTARAGFAVLEASGRLLSDLRGRSILGDYLLALGGLPHRVTRLDACLDVPTRAAPVLHELWAQVRRGGVRLSRKAVPATQCGHYFTPALYTDEPLDTGTVYVPSRRASRADRYLTVYDKRQERLSRGLPDPGHLLRYEASAARGMGATLGDAHDPTSIFYAIVPSSILPSPPGAAPWASTSDGWCGGSREAPDPVRRLDRYLSGSGGQALLSLAAHEGGISQIRRWLAQVEAGRSLAGRPLGSAEAPAEADPRGLLCCSAGGPGGDPLGDRPSCSRVSGRGGGGANP